MNFKNLLLTLSLLVFVSGCTEPKHNFFVFSKDPDTIDSLKVYVGKKTYLIEDLQSQKSKSLKIYNVGGKQISLQADTSKTLSLTEKFHPPFRGTIKLIITRDRIIANTTFSDYYVTLERG